MVKVAYSFAEKTGSFHTVDDINLHCLKDPELWELWYSP